MHTKSFIDESGDSFHFAALLRAWSKAPALETTAGVLTYVDLSRLLLQRCRRLRELKIGPHCRVGLYAPNNPEHLYLLLAAWMMNFTFVPLNHQTPLPQLLEHIGLDVLFAPAADLRSCPGLQGHDPATLTQTPDSITPADLPESIPLGQEAAVVFTSGSTGRPKGVVHSVANYLYSAAGTIDYLAVQPVDRWLISLPLFHVGGLLIFIRTLLAGAVSILPAASQNMEQILVQERPSLLSLVPTQLLRWMESKDTRAGLGGCRAILLGGAPAPAWLIQQACAAGLHILPTYGATESCAQMTGVAPGAAAEEIFTAGRVLAHRRLKLDHAGVIHIAGKTLFQYYLDSSARVYPFADGWFKTADVGAWDKRGNLILKGRCDEIFICGGENVNPFEIEQTLMAWPDIRAAVVVPVPDQEYGQVAWAFIQSDNPPPAWELAARLKQKLPGYKIPKRFLRLDNAAGGGELKLPRRTLQQHARQLARARRGDDVHIRQSGAGDIRTLVLLHGFMENGSVFEPLMARLGARCRCLAPDLPGHGQSQFADSQRLRRLTDIAAAAALLLEVLTQKGVTSFALLGYSMGGRIAQSMCLQAPERIQELILESASFGLADAQARRLRLQADRALLDGINSQAAFDTFLQRWHHSPLFGTLRDTPALDQLTALKRRGNPVELQRALALFSVGRQPLQTAALQATGIPIYYLVGAEDRKYHALALQAQALLPNMQLCIFAGASHNIHSQYPDEFCRVVEDILFPPTSNA